MPPHSVHDNGNDIDMDMITNPLLLYGNSITGLDFKQQFYKTCKNKVLYSIVSRSIYYILNI